MSSSSAGVHGISNRFVTDYAALDPIAATQLGLPGGEDELTDYSPEGHAARYGLNINAVLDNTAAEAADKAESDAKAVFLERSAVSTELYEAGRSEGDLNVIASPVQSLREIFDHMPTDT